MRWSVLPGQKEAKKYSQRNMSPRLYFSRNSSADVQIVALCAQCAKWAPYHKPESLPITSHTIGGMASGCVDLLASSES